MQAFAVFFSLLKRLVIDFEMVNIDLNTFSNLSNAQRIKCHTRAHILQLLCRAKKNRN